MASTFEIPLTPAPQTFFVSLVGTQYQFTLQWRDATGGGWILDIGDASGKPIVSGIPLVTGVNLLHQYLHLGLGFELWVQTDAADAPPTYTNLGITSHLYAVTN
ncbi:phage baseplate plug family protein [Paraburkholderia graminis]|uniref:phage baseplate plug family protein n=1 Tax=Paraburkholderia graminis TaxID=60548 RepID=UPI0038B927F7